MSLDSPTNGLTSVQLRLDLPRILPRIVIQAAQTRESLRRMVLALVTVVYPIAGYSQAPTIRVVESARIAGASFDIFGYSVRASLSPTGNLAVFNPNEGRILVFDSLGRHRETVGRTGRGPGEFARTAGGQFATRLGFVRDTLVALDDALRRVTLFRNGGAVARSFPYPTKLPAGFVSVQPLSLLAGQTFLAKAIGSSDALARRTSPRAAADSAFVVLNADGVIDRFIAAVPPDSNLVVVRASGYSRPAAPVPFRWDPRPATSPNGQLLVIATNEQSVDDRRHTRISVLRATGDTVFVVRIPYVGTAVTPRMIDSAMMKLRAITAPNAGMEQLVRARIPTVVTHFKPPVVGDDGTVWLPRNLDISSPPEFIVVSSRGKVSGTVRLPRGRSELRVVGANCIWVTELDDDGFYSLVRYTYRID